MNSIFKNYLELYGEPTRKAKYKSPDGKVIQIFKWDEDQTDEGVVMYATMGASITLGDKEESCEFFIGLTPDADDIADALAEVALYGNGTTHVPNSGDTVTLSYDLWHGTKARSFMFTDGDEIVPSTKDEHGRQIWFIQLVPLFEEELSYKKEYGEDALWGAFENAEVPYWSSSRSSLFK